MKKMCRGISRCVFFIAAFCPWLVAVGVGESQTAPAKRQAEPAKGLIRITPTEFFSGELKRLKPHVDFQASCFKIKTEGPLRCWLDIEVWCDGEEIKRGGRGYLDDPTSDEISLSFRQEIKKGDVWNYTVRTGGLITHGRSMDEPKSKQEIEVLFGPTAIRKPIELKSERESAIVWAVGAGHGFHLDNQVEAEKKLNAAPWAIVLRLRAEKAK